MELKIIRLVGVIPHTTPTISGQNELIYSVKCRYCGDIIRSRCFKSHLIKEHGISVKDYVLKQNDMTEDDLPTCTFCGTRKCRVGGNNNRIDLLNPKISPFCSSKKCGIAYNHYKQNKTMIKKGGYTEKVEKWKDSLKDDPMKIIPKKSPDGYYKSEVVMKSVLDELGIRHKSGKRHHTITFKNVELLNSKGTAVGRFALLDFYLPDYNICIECDGTSHRGRVEKDQYRDRILFEKLGIKTYRFRGGILFDKDKLKLQLLDILKSCELLETPKASVPQ